MSRIIKGKGSNDHSSSSLKDLVDEGTKGTDSTSEKLNGKPSASSSSSGANRKSTPASQSSAQPKSLYERIVGKVSFASNDQTSQKTGQILKEKVANWFSREPAEERNIRIELRNYKQKLLNELQFIGKATQRHRKRLLEQSQEFDLQEKQLIAWGLKGALSKFHMQAWYRLARCSLQENLSIEIENTVNERQGKVTIFLQQFEETKNRLTKYSLKGTKEFCQPPDALILLDYSILSLSDRLRRLDFLCSIATKQFLKLEPDFAWKEKSQRGAILITILNNYKLLPKVSDLDNIETTLTWSHFCHWVANRSHRLRSVEQQFSDFIEDQREIEGRLFYRWHTCVLTTYNGTVATIPGAALNINIQGNNNMAAPLDTRTVNAFNITSPGGPSNPNSSSSSSMMQHSPAPAGPMSSPIPTTTKTTRGGSSTPATVRSNGEGMKEDASAATVSASTAAGVNTPIGAGANAGADGKPHVTALRVTPASIKAFIRYFATDVVGSKYDVPKDYINAMIALTESLFYKRLAPFVFRYADREQHEQDEFWRLHCQKCRFVDPSHYHVPMKYYLGSAVAAAAKEKEKEKAAALAASTATNTASAVAHNAVPIAAAVSNTVPFSSIAPDTTHTTTTAATTGEEMSSSQRPSLTTNNTNLSSTKAIEDSVQFLRSSTTMIVPTATIPSSSAIPASPTGASSQHNVFPATPSTHTTTIQHPEHASSSSIATTPAAVVAVSTEENKIHTPIVPMVFDESMIGNVTISGDEAQQDLTVDFTHAAETENDNNDYEEKSRRSHPKEHQEHQEAQQQHQEQHEHSTMLIEEHEHEREFLDASMIDVNLEEGEEELTIVGNTLSGRRNTLDENEVYELGSGSVQQTEEASVTASVVAPAIAMDAITTITTTTTTTTTAAMMMIDNPQHEKGSPRHEDEPPTSTSNTNSPRTPPTHTNTNTNTTEMNRTGTTGNTITGGSSQSMKSLARAVSSSTNLSSTSFRGRTPTTSTTSPLPPGVSANHPPSCTCSYCTTFTMSKRLQKLPVFEEDTSYGKAYARASRVLTWMNMAVTPREMIVYLTFACQWILRDAIDISGSRSIIGADLMVPLFTLVLVGAQIPNIHMLLHILMKYGDYDEQGDISYNIANLEGSIMFLMSMDIPYLDTVDEKVATLPMYQSIAAACSKTRKHPIGGVGSAGGGAGGAAGSGGVGSGSEEYDVNSSMLGSSPPGTYSGFGATVGSGNSGAKEGDEDQLAMEELGEWLRDQRTMEDTIAILQNDGWML